jgi:hypothetical protein
MDEILPARRFEVFGSGQSLIMTVLLIGRAGSMRDLAIMILMILPMHAAGLALILNDSASGWAGYVIGANLVAIGLAIVRDDLTVWWRALRQGRDGIRAGPVDDDSLAADVDIIGWL